MSSSPWSRTRLFAAIALVPVLLFGPIIAAGQVFLPFLPVAQEPLARENPVAAAEAMRAMNAALGDRIYPFLVDQLAARAELAAGHLPTWEPLQSLGMPLLGGSIAGLAYPPNWLAYGLAPELAAAPLALFSLCLAGCGMLLFLRRLGLDLRAALIGALGMQLGGWGLANLYYYMKVDAALWLPWALWAVEGLAQRKRWSALALVWSLAASFLAGMVTISAFVFGVTALYALVRLGPWRRVCDSAERRGARALLTAAVLLGLGVAGGALQLLPLAEAGAASLRTPLSVQGATALGLPVTTTLGVLVPDLVGAPTDTTKASNLPLAWWLTPASQSERAELANVLEWNTYALVVLALLALVGVVAAPRRAAFPAALLMACFAFAQAWPLVRLLFAVPGLGVGAPGRVLGLAWVLWPWLAALGVEALLARAPRAQVTLLVAAFAATLGLFLAWRGLEPERWAEDLPRTLVAKYHQRFGTTLEDVRQRLPLEALLGAARHLQDSFARAFAAALALLLAASLVPLLERREARFAEGPSVFALGLGGALVLACACLPLALCQDGGARGPQALLGLSGVLALAGLGARSARADLALWFPFAALLVIEGFLGSVGHVQGRAVLSTGIFPPSPDIENVRTAAGDGRVMRLGPSADLGEVLGLARPNMLVPYGLKELNPYVAFTPRAVIELGRKIDERLRYQNHLGPLPDLALVARPALDLLRVQCVLSARPVQHPRLVPVLERPGFCVYRRLGALPAARIVPRALPSASDEEVLAALVAPDADFARATRIAPEDSARIPPGAPALDWRAGTISAVERPAKNRVQVRVAASAGGWLVLHEQWARGWTCSVNGSAVPLLRADHVYRAVPIPPGELELDFRYEPRSFEWGAALSLVALLGVLLFELLNREG